MRVSKKIKYGCIIFFICGLVGLSIFATEGIYMDASDREYYAIEQKTTYAEKYITNTFAYDLKLLNLFGNDYSNKNITSEQDEIASEMEAFSKETGIALCIVDESGIGYDYNKNLIDLNNYLDVSQMLSGTEGFIQPKNNLQADPAVIYLYSQVNENNQNYRLVGWYTKESLNLRYNIEALDGWNYVYIVDKDGNLVMPLEKANSWSNLYDYVNGCNNLKSVIKKGESHIQMYLCGLKENVICTRPLKGIDNWDIISVVPQKCISQKANIILSKVLTICGCFCISMIIIIYYIIRLIKNNVTLKIKDASNACKNRSWSQISHEIRTPMNAIIGMTEIAKYAIDDKEKMQECLNNIQDTSEYLLSVINDILDISKLESNKVQLNIEPFKVSEVIDTVKAISYSNINLKNIKMSVIRSGDLDEIVCGDQNRLKQVLVNLIGNAVKFTDINGKIKFCIKSERISEGKIKYFFEVTDSGIGIKKENLDKIFNPFEQADNSVSSIYGGSGLGLAICKGYISLMNGRITVESEYGKSTSFYVEVELPVADETDIEMYHNRINEAMQNDIAQIHLMDQTSNDNKKCILLADDNDMNLEVTTTMLEYFGYQVVVAHNGQEAVNLFETSKSNQFDAILMDVQMPVKNGLDAAMEIRKMNREDAKCIKIIALTASAFKEDMDLTKEAGMNMHISKPIKMKELKDKLGEMFSQS